MFEWNRSKAETNAADHGVTFHDAACAFDDSLGLDLPARSGRGEWRGLRIVRAVPYPLVAVVYTRRISDGEAHIRIISARAASQKERRRYAAVFAR